MPNASGSDEGLLIPIPKRSLGQFISGLLGQRREINRSITDKNFLIDFNWISNLDEIIGQRVSSQNEGQLVDFSAKIFFDDGRVTSLTTRESFKSFRDFSSSLSVGVDITWHFLIAFPGRGVPEKQEVRFYGFTDKRFRSGRPQEYQRSTSFINSPDDDEEELNFNVSFTDLSWGEDLASQITRYIDSTLSNRGPVYRVIKKLETRNAIIFIAFLMSVSSIFFIDDSPSGPARSDLLQKALELQGPSIENIQRKIDSLISNEMVKLAEPAKKWGMLKFFYFGGLIFVAYFVISLYKTSFITLNEFSERFYRDKNKNYEVLKYGVGLAAIIGMICGIFSSKLFEYLKVAGIL